MHVRPATTQDLEAIVGLGIRFIDGSIYREITPASQADLARLSGWLLEHGVVILLVDDDDQAVGLLGGAIIPNHINLALFAHEFAWWVDEPARGHGWMLVEAFEAWAQAEGAIAVVLVAPEGLEGPGYRRALERLYRQKRYRSQESTWLRFLIPEAEVQWRRSQRP